MQAHRHQGREPEQVADGEAEAHENPLWPGDSAVGVRRLERFDGRRTNV